MGLNTRPATCASCGKRLSRKLWYYRNGAYFCKTRCWETEKAKRQEQAAAAGVEGIKSAEGAKEKASETQPAKAETAAPAGDGK